MSKKHQTQTAPKATPAPATPAPKANSIDDVIDRSHVEELKAKMGATPAPAADAPAPAPAPAATPEQNPLVAAYIAAGLNAEQISKVLAAQTANPAVQATASGSIRNAAVDIDYEMTIQPTGVVPSFKKDSKRARIWEALKPGMKVRDFVRIARTVGDGGVEDVRIYQRKGYVKLVAATPAPAVLTPEQAHNLSVNVTVAGIQVAKDASASN